MVENLPANAGYMGSSPGLRRSHMPRSNQTHEPQLLSLRVWSLCSATREAVTVRGLCTTMKSGPCSPQLEKALAQKRTPDTAINKIKKKKKKKSCVDAIIYLFIYLLLEDLVLCLLSDTALSREISTKTIILNQACISALPGKVKYT